MWSGPCRPSSHPEPPVADLLMAAPHLVPSFSALPSSWRRLPCHVPAGLLLSPEKCWNGTSAPWHFVPASTSTSKPLFILLYLFVYNLMSSVRWWVSWNQKLYFIFLTSSALAYIRSPINAESIITITTIDGILTIHTDTLEPRYYYSGLNRRL